MWEEYGEGALRAGASCCLIRVMCFVKLQWARCLIIRVLAAEKYTLGRVESRIGCRLHRVQGWWNTVRCVYVGVWV